MSKEKVVVIEIEQFLRGADLRKSPEFERLALTYTTLVHDFLTDLQETEKLLSLNNIDKLVELLYKSSPSLEERARILMFEKRQEWIDLCEEYEISLPEYINIERLHSLGELSKDKRLLPSLLNNWRIINRNGTTTQKLEVLRKINILSTDNPLTTIHTKIAKQYAEELINDAKQAIITQNFNELNRIEQLLKSADIAPHIPSNVLDKIQKELKKWSQNTHRKLVDEALLILNDAYALYDLEGVRKSLNHLKTLQSDPNYQESSSDIEQINSAQSWHDELTSTQEAEENYQHALRQLDQCLDDKNFTEAEKIRYNILQIMGNSIPELTEIRFHELGELLKYKVAVKFKITMVIVILCVLFLGGIGIYTIQVVQERDVEKAWFESIELQIKAKNFNQAQVLLTQFIEKKPKIANHQTVVVFQSEIENNMRQIQIYKKKITEHIQLCKEQLKRPVNKDQYYYDVMLNQCKKAEEELKNARLYFERVKAIYPEYEIELNALRQQITTLRTEVQNDFDALKMQELFNIKSEFSKLATAQLLSDSQCQLCEQKMSTLSNQLMILFQFKFKKSADVNIIKNDINLMKSIIKEKITISQNKLSLARDFENIQSLESYKRYIKAEIKKFPSSSSKYTLLTDDVWKIYEDVAFLSQFAANPEKLTHDEIKSLETRAGFEKKWKLYFEKIMKLNAPIDEKAHQNSYSIFDILRKAFDSFPFEFIFKNEKGENFYVYSLENPKVVKTTTGRIFKCGIKAQLSLSTQTQLKLSKKADEWLVEDCNFLDKSYKKVSLFDSTGNGSIAEHDKFLRSFKTDYDNASPQKRITVLKDYWENLKKTQEINPWWYYHLGSYILRLSAISYPIASEHFTSAISSIEKLVPVEDREWFSPGPSSNMRTLYIDAIQSINYEKILKDANEENTLLYKCLNRALIPSGILLKNENGELYIRKFITQYTLTEFWAITPSAERGYDFHIVSDLNAPNKIREDSLQGRFEYELIWSPTLYSTDELSKQSTRLECPLIWPINAQWSQTK